jgi:hypothetical protein
MEWLWIIIFAFLFEILVVLSVEAVIKIKILKKYWPSFGMPTRKLPCVGRFFTGDLIIQAFADEKIIKEYIY